MNYLLVVGIAAVILLAGCSQPSDAAGANVIQKPILTCDDSNSTCVDQVKVIYSTCTDYILLSPESHSRIELTKKPSSCLMNISIDYSNSQIPIRGHMVCDWPMDKVSSFELEGEDVFTYCNGPMKDDLEKMMAGIPTINAQAP